MSWYDANYRYRVPIAVDNSGAAGSPKDVTVTIPADWDLFWSNVLSTGFDLRMTSGDGRTLVPFKRTTWTYASKVGVLDVDDMVLSNSSTDVLWLYWGYASATDAAVSVHAPATPLTGRISLAAPSVRVVKVRPEDFAATKPRAQFAKTSAAAGWIFWDFTGVLPQRRTRSTTSKRLDEINAVALVDVQLATATQAAMIDVTKTRLFDGGVMTWIKAGTSGVTYTAICKITTVEGLTIEARALVKVQDIKE